MSLVFADNPTAEDIEQALDAAFQSVTASLNLPPPGSRDNGGQINREKLNRYRYLASEGHTIKTAAKVQGVTYQAVHAYARKHGIQFRKDRLGPRGVGR